MVNTGDIAAVIRRFFPMSYPSLLKAPTCLIDVGVGCGTEAWEIGQTYPGIKIIGLEPSVEMHQKTIEMRYPGELLSVGAWSHCRKHQLSRLKRESNLYYTRPFVADGGDFEEVELRPLDELIDTYSLQPGIILWLDIEGSELEALRGAWRLLQSRVVLINAEVRATPKFQSACSEAEVDAFLAAFGFAKTLVYNRHTGDDPHHDAIYVRSCLERTW